MKKTERIMMLFSIVGRGRGVKLMEMLNEKNIKFHLQSVGFGTAPSEMSEILGLGSTDKDIIISLAAYSRVQALASDFAQNLDELSGYGGLMMIISPSGINRITAEIISQAAENNSEKGAEEAMNSENKHSLVLVIVNQGYSDDVMQIAKKAGATGGTVIKARLAGAEQMLQIAGVDTEEEKEIVAIFAPNATRDAIMTELNANFGLRTESKGVVMSLPVDKAFKI